MTDPPPGHSLPLPGSSVQEELLSFLCFLRAALLRKLEGLGEDAVRWTPVASGTSLLGLVHHLAVVELYWVHHRIGGLAVDIGDDQGFEIGPDDSGRSVTDHYRAVAARSDEILAGCDAGAPLLRSRQGRTAGWVLVHLVQETARHAGHADVLRELLDGTVGM